MSSLSQRFRVTRIKCVECRGRASLVASLLVRLMDSMLVSRRCSISLRPPPTFRALHQRPVLVNGTDLAGGPAGAPFSRRRGRAGAPRVLESALHACFERAIARNSLKYARLLLRAVYSASLETADPRGASAPTPPLAPCPPLARPTPSSAQAVAIWSGAFPIGIDRSRAQLWSDVGQPAFALPALGRDSGQSQGDPFALADLCFKQGSGANKQNEGGPANEGGLAYAQAVLPRVAPQRR